MTAAVFSALLSTVIKCCFWGFSSLVQVSKPSQEAYQNELNIESVERSFILSARSATDTEFLYKMSSNIWIGVDWLQLNLTRFLLVAECSVISPLQLGHRERRVAGGHRQGHRRLHQEENNLHIQPQSGGGNDEGRVASLA